MFEISVASAVVAFNDGAAGSLKIMDKIGLHIGHINLKSSLCSDLKRISTANYKSSTPVKKQRKLRYAVKKGYYYYYFQFCYHQIITWNSIQYLHIEKGNHAFQFSVSRFR